MTPLARSQLFAYGGLGLPLAFAALPLYVHLAPFYGQAIGLGLLGVLLLGMRFLDAVIDPLLGALFDRHPYPRTLIALSLPLLGIGWIALFNPPAGFPVVGWLVLTLALTTVGYSLATVVHTSWGARIHSDPHQRTRLFATREGFGLVGVVLAAALPLWLADTLQAGLPRMGWVFIGLLLIFGIWTLTATPPVKIGTRPVDWKQWMKPFANPAFARFVPGFLLNGVAAALPATLVIFFIDDVLALSSSSGVFLALYFASGALGLPLWVALARRIGKLEAWLLSMLLAVASFAGAFWLGAGDWRSGAAARAGGGLSRPRPSAPAWSLLRPDELFCQIRSRPFGRTGIAPARFCRLCARRRPHPGAIRDLCPASLPAQDRRHRLVLGATRSPSNRSLSMLKPLAILCTVLGLSGCAGVSPETYREQKPALDLATYFNGPLTAWGYFADRSGEVKRRFTVNMVGEWKGNEGVLTR